MTVYAWNRPFSGNWNDPQNWTPGGGPQQDPEEYLPITQDDALFATGSTHSYTVSGTYALANSITVVGDRVNFNHFSLGNWGPATLAINSGARVNVSADSSLWLATHDAFGGTLNIDNASLTVQGQVQGGTYATAVLTDGASVRVIGQGAYVGADSYVSLATVDATSKVAVSLGGTWDFATTLDGTLTLAAGNVTQFQTIDPSGLLRGFGEVTSGIYNDGTVEAKGGTLRVDQGIIGSGVVEIDRNSKLSLGGQTDDTITFNGANAQLILQQGATVNGFISGFSKGDSIELVGQNITAISLQDDGVGGTIIDAIASGQVANELHFAGQIAPQQLRLQHDGHGDTLISYSNHIQIDPSIYMAPIPTT